MRALFRSLDLYSLATGALLVVSLAAFAVWAFAPAEAAPRTKRPTVFYVDCSHGHHLWVTEQGGIYGVPAGADC